MKSAIHFYTFTVLETYLDRNDHLNHAMYLRLFEEARWDMITQNGYGLHRMQETGVGPIILAFDLKFRRELRLRQKVIISTKVLSVKKKLSTIEQQMKTPDGQTCCIALFTFGLFDAKTRKLVPPTPEWLNAIGFEPI